MVKPMKVRRTECLAGPDMSVLPGDVMDVPDAVGEEWIRIGHAVAVDDGPGGIGPDGAIQTATAPGAPEKAVKPRARKR